MHSLSDQQLLNDYVQRRAEAAFGELVRRYVDFVYSAALRMVRDAPLAQDVAQGVFVALSQRAAQLTERQVLSGWLHRTAQNLAANAVRSEARRRAREQEAAAMNELLGQESDAAWDEIAPCLDSALGELEERDRDALLLRYFQRKSAREMAEKLGTTEEAAQKRVSRAVERLRETLAKHGVTAGTAGICVSISANAVQAAPAGLACSISTAVALAAPATAIVGSTATNTLAMTILQKTLVGVTLAAAIGITAYETRQASILRAQVTALREQQATQARAPRDSARVSPQDTVEALEAKNTNLSVALTQANAERIRLEQEREQAKHVAALFKELVEQANSRQDFSATNEFPTSRHVWVEWGRLGRLSAELKQDESKMSPEEKAAAQAAQIRLLDQFVKAAKVMKQLEAVKGSSADSPEEGVDDIACLLYGALNLDEQQFNQIFSLAEKYRALAKEKGISRENTAPENSDARKQMTEEAITEFKTMLTAEQSRIFEGVLPHLQMEPGKLTFSFGF